MDDKKQSPIFGKPNGSLTILFWDAGVFHANKRIEKDLAGYLKPDRMPGYIDGRLF